MGTPGMSLPSGFPSFSLGLEPPPTPALPSTPSQRKPVRVDSGAAGVTAVSPPSSDLFDFVLFLQLFTPGKGRGKRGEGMEGDRPHPTASSSSRSLHGHWGMERKGFPGNVGFFFPGFGVPGTARTPDRTGDLFPLFLSVFCSRCSQPTPAFPVISPAHPAFLPGLE